MGRFGLQELLDTAIAEPSGKSIEEVIHEWAQGKHLSSTEMDLQKFLDSAKDALESAFSAGVLVASIRFVSSLICAANQKPEYYRDIKVAMKIYAHYGDSRWRGIKNLWWRFSILNHANVRLIDAQCLAEEKGRDRDVARILLLRGLLAQAAGVWSEADKLFAAFVANAQETITRLEAARVRNEEMQRKFEE